jgi:hypothetical protein
MQVQDFLGSVIGYIGVFCLMVTFGLVAFRFLVAAARRRIQVGQSWFRAIGGGAVDALRYVFLRVAHYADKADAEMRTDDTETGNPQLSAETFVFWVGAVVGAMLVACILPRMFFGMDAAALVRLLDEQAASLWLSCFTLLLPLLIAWRERDLMRRQQVIVRQWQDRCRQLTKALAEPDDVRSALRTVAERMTATRRAIDALGAAPETDTEARDRHTRETLRLINVLQRQLRKQKTLEALLSESEGRKPSEPRAARDLATSFARWAVLGILDVSDDPARSAGRP